MGLQRLRHFRPLRHNNLQPQNWGSVTGRDAQARDYAQASLCRMDCNPLLYPPSPSSIRIPEPHQPRMKPASALVFQRL